MKRNTILLWVLLLATLTTEAQEKTKLFRFNPTQLITSTLSVGFESFNEDLSRSSVLNLGIRYKSDDNLYYGSSTRSTDQFDYWKGITANYEYRFYIPSFKKKAPNWLNEDYGQSGVYLAPNFRFDYNNHKYDRSYYDFKYDGNTQEEFLVTDKGTINYLGFMPAISMGVQFNVFQHGYIDLYIGGGLRINAVNELQKTNSDGGSYYYGSSNAITELIIREGVRPTGGITFGIKI